MCSKKSIFYGSEFLPLTQVKELNKWPEKWFKRRFEGKEAVLMERELFEWALIGVK